MSLVEELRLRAAAEIARTAYDPPAWEWPSLYQMLCGHCTLAPGCQITDDMIEMKSGGAWPEGGWVTDPGAGVTCLSYSPRPGPKVPRQQLRNLKRLPDGRLPEVCGGCAARKGSEASVSLHTRRDFAAAVKAETRFDCHEKPGICGGWCRAIKARA